MLLCMAAIRLVRKQQAQDPGDKGYAPDSTDTQADEGHICFGGRALRHLLLDQVKATLLEESEWVCMKSLVLQWSEKVAHSSRAVHCSPVSFPP